MTITAKGIVDGQRMLENKEKLFDENEINIV